MRKFTSILFIIFLFQACDWKADKKEINQSQDSTSIPSDDEIARNVLSNYLEDWMKYYDIDISELKLDSTIQYCITCPDSIGNPYTTVYDESIHSLESQINKTDRDVNLFSPDGKKYITSGLFYTAADSSFNGDDGSHIQFVDTDNKTIKHLAYFGLYENLNAVEWKDNNSPILVIKMTPLEDGDPHRIHIRDYDVENNKITFWHVDKDISPANIKKEYYLYNQFKNMDNNQR